MQQMHYSGQVGTVTLFHAPSNSGTLVVLNVQGQRQGRPEAASIQRGESCSPSGIDNRPTWVLNNVSDGHSATVVNTSPSRLLSGNYSVVVHGGTPIPIPKNASKKSMLVGGNMMLNGMVVSKARWQPVVCGHLYG